MHFHILVLQETYLQFLIENLKYPENKIKRIKSLKLKKLLQLKLLIKKIVPDILQE